MDNLSAWFNAEVWPVWEQGGWLMPALALLALGIYYAALELWRESNRWPLRRMLALSDGELDTGSLPAELQRAINWSQIADVTRSIDAMRRRILNRLDRRMIFLAFLTSAAPLTGLLGTVSGLLTTFRSLSTQTGPLAEGAATGLYAALVTTQTGLIIAIPAYILLYALRRRRDEWAAAITHVESLALRGRRKEAA